MVWFSNWSQNKGGEPEFNHTHVLCLECNVSRIDLGFSYYTFSQWFSRQLLLRTYNVSGTVWGPGKAPMSNTISIPVLVILTMSHRQAVKQWLPEAISRTAVTRASPLPVEQGFSSSDLWTPGPGWFFENYYLPGYSFIYSTTKIIKWLLSYMQAQL